MEKMYPQKFLCEIFTVFQRFIYFNTYFFSVKCLQIVKKKTTFALAFFEGYVKSMLPTGKISVFITF